MGSVPLRQMLYPQAAYELLMLADTCCIHHICDVSCNSESMIKMRDQNAIMIVIRMQSGLRLECSHECS